MIFFIDYAHCMSGLTINFTLSMQLEASPAFVPIDSTPRVWLVLVLRLAERESCVVWNLIKTEMQLLVIPIHDRCVQAPYLQVPAVEI